MHVCEAEDEVAELRTNSLFLLNELVCRFFMIKLHFICICICINHNLRNRPNNL